MRVVENKGVNYTLHDLVRDININVHASRLKQFYYDDSHIDPLYVAAKDYEEDEVETIISHSGDPKRKASMDFLVCWKSYDESEDLWIPWHELMHNPKLHEYLIANKMKSLIPKEHK